MSEILSAERGRMTNRALNAPSQQSLAWQLYGDIDWKRRHVPSANTVADGASRWADAGLLSPASVFTPSLHWFAKRAGEVAKYLAGLDPVRRACASRPTKKCVLELFAGSAYLSGAVLANKLVVGVLLEPPVEVCLIFVANQC